MVHILAVLWFCYFPTVIKGIYHTNYASYGTVTLHEPVALARGNGQPHLYS